jgi:hypothetical protein
MLTRGLLWALTTVVVAFLMLRLLDKLGAPIASGTDEWYVAVGGVAVAIFLLFWLAGGTRRTHGR